jgi:hypothetical protein
LIADDAVAATFSSALSADFYRIVEANDMPEERRGNSESERRVRPQKGIGVRIG